MPSSGSLGTLPSCSPVWGQRLCPSAPGLGLALLLGRAAAVCAQVGTACATNQQGMRHRLLCCWGHWAGESGHDPHFQLLSEPQGSFCSAFGVLCAGLWQLQSNPVQLGTCTFWQDSISIPCSSPAREFSSPKPPPVLTLTSNDLTMTQILAQMPRSPSSMEPCLELQDKS